MGLSTGAVRNVFKVVAIFKYLDHATNQARCTLWYCIDGHEPEFAFVLLRHRDL